MGVLRDVVNEFDKSAEISDEVKEALAMLVSLTKEKQKTAEAVIESDLKTGKLTDNLTVPITKVIASKSEYRCKTYDGVDMIPKVVDSLKDMFSGDGDVLRGIAEIADTALNAIVGAGEGEETEVKTYSVVAEYPAIVRFDFYFWGRNTKASSIKSKIETAFTCVGYKSAVDVEKLDFNAFLALYGPILVKAYGDDKTKLKSMIEEAKEIFELFKVPVGNVDDSVNLVLNMNDKIYTPQIVRVQKSTLGII